jgi:cyclomaltodextrinase / maltogenic alpha-amylase / neopullulanase
MARLGPGSRCRQGVNADRSLFVFGHLATPEHLAAEARKAATGILHGAQIDPRDPAPGEAVEVLVDTGAQAAIDSVRVRYSTNGLPPELDSPEVAARRLAARWDDLAWSYVDRWGATLPPQPEGTTVRYCVEGQSSLSGSRIFANGASGGEAPEIYSYEVDCYTTPPWVDEAIIYQIFVDRFYDPDTDFSRPPAPKDEVYGGTLVGVRERLPYLVGLGINTLWLTPIFESETYHGYDAVDYESVARRFGGDHALRTLVREAHAHGIRILLDFAANHCSWHNPRFVDAQRNPKSPYRSWFAFAHWPDRYDTFFEVASLPKLDTHRPEVAQYLYDVAAGYLSEFQVDGFRLDYALGPPLSFWSGFRTRTKVAKADAYTVGEATASPRGLRDFEGRLDGCLDFPLVQAFRQFFIDRSLDAPAFDHFLERHGSFFDPSFSRPTFLDNHDMNRFLWEAKGDTGKLKLAATCQFSLRQPPIVYYGTEVGLSQNVGVEEGGLDTSRLPMLWDNRQNLDLLDFYRTLIEARRKHPALRANDRTTLVARGGLYVFTCHDDRDHIIVALNNSDAVQDVSLRDVRGTDLLSGMEVSEQIRLQPFQSALVSIDPSR